MAENKIINEAGISLSVKMPLLPYYGQPGYIVNAFDSNKVLGVVNDAITSGSEVTFDEPLNSPNNIGAQWRTTIRGKLGWIKQVESKNE